MDGRFAKNLGSRPEAISRLGSDMFINKVAYRCLIENAQLLGFDQSVFSTYLPAYAKLSQRQIEESTKTLFGWDLEPPIGNNSIDKEDVYVDFIKLIQ